MIRLYTTARLASGQTAPLTEAQAHYLRNVMRQEVGASITLFNGQDGEWQGELTSLGKKGATVTAQKQLRPQAAGPDIWLCPALIKRSPMEMVMEKATELGARKLCPVITRRTEMPRLNEERMQSILIEAAEQCERLDVPELAAPARLEKLLADWPAGRPLYVAAERQAAAPPLPPYSGPAALLIGPEGGFAAEELTILAAHPAVKFFNLGPSILRAETASLAALALWTCHDLTRSA